MGIHDREYYRDESTPWGANFGAAGGMSLVTKLIIVNGAVFVATLFAPWLQGVLSAHDDTIVKPWMWWQFITYGFAHGSVNHILFNMLGLFFLGRTVEAHYGGKEFLCFYMLSLIAGSVIWGARTHFDGVEGSAALLGASGAVTAVVMLFIFNFPHQKLLLMMVIPMPAWMVGVMIIVLNVMSVGPDNVAYDVHLVGAAFAACYFFLGWNFSRILPGGDWTRPMRGGAAIFKSGPKLKVHDPQRDFRELDTEADRVLAKLHREGEASLTARERKVLEDYSRRMQQKHR